MALPTVLQVPIPNGNFIRRYGVYSTRHPSAGRVTVRLGAEQHELMKRAAKMLGMSDAEFVREGVAALSKAILKHAEDYNANPSDGDG